MNKLFNEMFNSTQKMMSIIQKKSDINPNVRSYQKESTTTIINGKKETNTREIINDGKKIREYRNGELVKRKKYIKY